MAEALRRLPPDVIQARNARLRRAIDLDMKHDHLHGELLAKQTPAESYLQVRTILRQLCMPKGSSFYLGAGWCSCPAVVIVQFEPCKLGPSPTEHWPQCVTKSCVDKVIRLNTIAPRS